MTRPTADRTSRRGIAFLAGCLLAAACKDAPTTPVGQGPLADAAAVSAALGVMNGVLTTPAMQSLQALGGLMRISPSAPASVGAMACGAPLVETTVQRGPSRSLTALIPDTLRRRVFVYDVATGTYQASTDTSGPATGVRYLLYSVDSFSRVTLPLTSGGWLDLSDQGGTANSIRAQVTDGATGVADYVVAPSGTQAADTASLSGTLTDGTHALLFQDSTANVGSTQWIAASVADSIDDVHVRMFAARTSFDPFDFTDTLDFTIARGADTVRARGHIQTYCLVPSTGLIVSVDGVDFAAVTNGTGGLNVARLDHVPLAPDQIQAILDMKDAQQRLFRGLGAMVTPARLLLPPN